MMSNHRKRPETNDVEETDDIEVETPSTYDAWAIAQAIAGRDIDPEDQRISDVGREFLRTLAEYPSNDPAGDWKQYVACMVPEAERDAWIKAVEATDPNGPPPEDEGDSGNEGDSEETEPDDDAAQPAAPEVEPFPLDIYPSAVQNLIRCVAQSTGCPVDFPALAVLVVAGAASGRSVSIHLKAGYNALPNFYALCVGLPGTGKSPAINAVVKPLRQIGDANYATWKKEKVIFEALNDAYKRALRQTLPESLDPNDSDEIVDPDVETTKPGRPAIPAKPVPPVWKRTVIGDSTVEALPVLLQQNPRGLLQFNDEGSALVASMNQYKNGNGSDRQSYLSLWSGSFLDAPRKKEIDNPIVVSDPFLCYFGGMVPDMIGSLFDKRGRNDGFPDRFLFAYPDPVPKPDWTDDGIPDEVVNEWSKIIGRLYAIPMKTTPLVVNFSPKSRPVWRERYNAHQAESSEAGFPQSLDGPWTKLEQYAGRFVPALHLLGLAADPARSTSVIPDVSAETVENAWRLATYFKSHARRVYGVNRKDATSVNPAVKPAGVQIMALMKGRDHWQGTCTELLEELIRLGGDDVKRQEGWPADATRLSKVLRDLVPTMQTQGFNLEFDKRKHDGRSVQIHRIVPLGVEDKSKDEPREASANPTEEIAPPEPTQPAHGGYYGSGDQGYSYSSQLAPLSKSSQPAANADDEDEIPF